MAIGINTGIIGQAAIAIPKHKAVITEANPVFAPELTATVDSTKEVTVVAPIPAPNIVATASTLLALPIQFLSNCSRSAIRLTAIKVPVVSKKSVYKNDNTAT